MRLKSLILKLLWLDDRSLINKSRRNAWIILSLYALVVIVWLPMGIILVDYSESFDEMHTKIVKHVSNDPSIPEENQTINSLFITISDLMTLSKISIRMAILFVLGIVILGVMNAGILFRVHKLFEENSITVEDNKKK